MTTKANKSLSLRSRERSLNVVLEYVDIRMFLSMRLNKLQVDKLFIQFSHKYTVKSKLRMVQIWNEIHTRAVYPFPTVQYVLMLSAVSS